MTRAEKNERWRKVPFEIRAAYAAWCALEMFSIAAAALVSPWFFCVATPMFLYGWWAEKKYDGYIIDMTPYWPKD